ncbi:diguanylate cyclase (GGDEF) domain-containing protein [Ruminococcus sp. YE71]|uniref:transporter substrate-binding domain-containing diguanylate cyclase n=1 Tax=unclassified Ruminococcus TaxID=2608920 RepID=UPI00088B2297|nr:MULTISPECIES: transporter substrate-binding domain-containing protein [unclassified Ruminococcus]SDA14370.1 diguanylate cyclase (GGDEF) domain-containing protein [Ruminococcus sp. YE78]SFW20936.1 diguanylate cyclase (GGDEF) domain-containing protein [Ruminococcus sp. YE71]
MYTKLAEHSIFKRITAVLLCLVMMTVLMPQLPVRAQTTGRTVRVGWHEAPYFITDENGRHSGYTYDYQQKIAAYTGWNYEYVEGSWTELLQMLKNGEIDMMGNISYMEERAKDILYASLPMGTETYYLFVAPDNKEIQADDTASLNGKKIGVAKESIQCALFKEWTASHGIDAEIVEMSGAAEESLPMLGNGIDAYVTMDVYANLKKYVPVWKIGSSDYFFAVSKKSSDLLNDLNYAMNRIQDENKFFSQELNEKYLRNSETALFLTDRELEWLSAHSTIRVGYQDNHLAFCAKDPRTGELTGALKDYLDCASTALENAQLRFEPVAYPTVSEAIEALKKGEIDCVFPANMSYSDSESEGLVITPAMMSTEMHAVVRSSDKKSFLQKKRVTAAVNQGNTNYVLFLKENFPDWDMKYYENTDAALEAVADKEADCIIISNYRFGNISKKCEKLHLSTVYTGVNMDYYFAVRKGDTDLYSILSRITVAVPDATIHTALTYYSAEDVKTGIIDIIKDNMLIVMTVISAVLLVILLLLLRSIKAERKAMAKESMVKALNRKVYVDALTSVRNKGAFADFINDIQERIEKGEIIELAIGILDCDGLKSVNDIHGHEKGDEYLKAASRLICRIFQHSPVFRIGGDEFAVVLQNIDFSNRDKLIEEFEAEKRAICEAAKNPWEEVRVSAGIAVYDSKRDNTVNDTVRRADEIMYANKSAAKKAREAQSEQ